MSMEQKELGSTHDKLFDNNVAQLVRLHYKAPDEA
jgi:hypothetical protein